MTHYIALGGAAIREREMIEYFQRIEFTINIISHTIGIGGQCAFE